MQDVGNLFLTMHRHRDYITEIYPLCCPASLAVGVLMTSGCPCLLTVLLKQRHHPHTATPGLCTHEMHWCSPCVHCAVLYELGIIRMRIMRICAMRYARVYITSYRQNFYSVQPLNFACCSLVPIRTQCQIEPPNTRAFGYRNAWAKR